MKNTRLLGALMLMVVMLSMLFGCGSETKNQTEAQTAGENVTNPPAKNAEKMELNVLNWGDYIDDEVLDDFKKEYPYIKVVYETMASNEEMIAKLQNENSIYDICFPSDYTISKLIKLDLLAELDIGKIPNVSNIDERFLNKEFDPDNKYSIPYHWGTVGILYNKTMVTEDVDNWSVLWDPSYRKQIFMYNSMRDSLGIALKRLGYSMNTTDPQELAQAENSLIDQKPLVAAYGIDDLRDKMIGGAGAFAVIYSGDAVAAMDENPDLDYAVPNEGSNIWFDNMVLLKNSKNTEAAYLFMDYLCRPDVAKRNTEYIGYSTPNKAALELVDPELKENPVYNPPQDVIDRCEIFQDLGDFLTEYNDAWLRIKAAK